MKKLSILTLAASTILLSGCADEFGKLDGGTKTVSFTTVLPTAPTRAFGDGTSVDKLYCFVYQGNELIVTVPAKEITSKTANVSVQLANGVDYKIVFWASNAAHTDVVETMPTELNKSYTFATTTGDLKVDYSKTLPNDEGSDAFYAVYNYKGGDPDPEVIKLYRPFAQVNVGSNDTKLKVVESAYNNGIYSRLEYQGWTDMNLVSGTVNPDKQTTVTTPMALIPSGTDNPYPVDSENTAYTNMAYVLVPQGNSSLINIKCKFYTSSTAENPKIEHTIGSIPVQKNYRTNVYGSLLTSTTQFTVNIAPAFFDPDINNPKPVINATKVADINDEFATGKYSGKEVDINVAEPITQAIKLPAMGAATTVNLNMNGNALTGGITAGRNVIVNVTNEATTTTRTRSGWTRTTIDGEVTSGNVLFTAEAGATINIYSGNYTTNEAVIALADGGNINIYGGRYHANKHNEPLGKKVVHATNGGAVKVYGGYFRTLNMNNATLAEMGITPDAACKVTRHSETEIGTDDIWLLVERVWHPGIDLASLEWETIGTGKFKDPWFGPCFKVAHVDWADENGDLDYENFGELSVTIKRCKTYPTLYKIEDPYITASQTWLGNYKEPDLMNYMCGAIQKNGAIIFDLNNTECVPVVPNVFSGIPSYNNPGDKMRNYNLEGAAYYNHRNCVPSGTAHSLGTLSYFNDYSFGGHNLLSFKNDLTRYEKGSRTLQFRNIVFDVTESYHSDTHEDVSEYFAFPWYHGESDWQAKCRGYLIFPDNFVLLDVYGNPVK